MVLLLIGFMLAFHNQLRYLVRSVDLSAVEMQRFACDYF